MLTAKAFSDMSHALLPLLLGFQAAHVMATSPLCYYPNGGHSGEVPCNLTAEVSHCCSSLDKCLSNGLCIWDAKESSGISYVRGTCTDQSWTHALCPRQCLINQDTPTNSSAYDFRASGVLILECGAQGYGKEANYCCESSREGTRCCKTSTAVFRLSGATKGAFTGPATTSFSSPSYVALTASTATMTPSSLSTLSDSQQTVAGDAHGSKRDTRGVRIGAGVGGAIGGLLAIIALIMIFRWKQKRQNSKTDTSGVFHHDLRDERKAEMDTDREVVEMPARERIHELPAGADRS
ncbi:hypothetical protein BDV96DRAFT_668429 [Lophiotrema nucula]|uniref:Mid2 domain-containing protein n=1 Tax=Lophiotrema nucula TaxID=690887 RepID=A0A6A5ZRT5_9PLEO|nr:hypothetical protein BDV96DRAFT_668429 [Lophiotrema nucula]